MDVSNKVAVATGTATVLAGAMCTVAIWLIRSRYQVEVPPDVRDAAVVILGAIITGVVTLIAAWTKKEENPAPSAVATLRREHKV
jgi:hypothetical protein